MLWREGGESIFLRIPIYVLDGELDHSKALIEFGTPFVIKHVVNIGLDHDENSFLTPLRGWTNFKNHWIKTAIFMIKADGLKPVKSH